MYWIGCSQVHKGPTFEFVNVLPDVIPYFCCINSTTHIGVNM